MGNAPLVASSGAEPRLPPSEAASGKPAKKGTKKAAKTTKGDTKLIVEKRVEGLNMAELQGIMDELKGMRAIIEKRKGGGGGGGGGGEEEEEEEDDSKLPLLYKLHKRLKSTVDEDAPVNEKLKKQLPFRVTATFWFLSKIAFFALLAYFTYRYVTANPISYLLRRRTHAMYHLPPPFISPLPRPLLAE